MSVGLRGKRAESQDLPPYEWTLARIILILVCLGTSLPATGQLLVSPGNTVEIDEDRVDDDQLYQDVVPNVLTPVALPTNAELSGYDADLTSLYFSVDITSVIEGVTVEPRDVAKWDGSTLTIELDGSAEGIPNGARVDAVVFSPTHSLLISLDTSAVIGGMDVDDEDLFRVSTPLLFFDGDQHGVDPALDLNGAVLSNPETLLLSFDTSGEVDGFNFDDEDVIAFDLLSETFILESDGSAVSPNLAAVDVTAVPEPSVSFMLAGALLSVAGRAASKRRHGSKSGKPS